MRLAGAAAFILGAALSIAIAPPASAGSPGETATPGGTLVIRQLDSLPLGNHFLVTLGDQHVLETKLGDDARPFADFPVPGLLKYVDREIGAYDAVVVFQQSNWGNACAGGPIWFLGIHRNGAFSRSIPIDACSTAPPAVTVQNGAIDVILAGSPNVATQEWHYSGTAPERIR